MSVTWCLGFDVHRPKVTTGVSKVVSSVESCVELNDRYTLYVLKRDECGLFFSDKHHP